MIEGRASFDETLVDAAIKWDDFMLHQKWQSAGLKAVDFIVLDNNNLMFIELKDYSTTIDPNHLPKGADLALIFVNKLIASIGGFALAQNIGAFDQYHPAFNNHYFSQHDLKCYLVVYDYERTGFNKRKISNLKLKIGNKLPNGLHFEVVSDQRPNWEEGNFKLNYR